MKIIKTLVTLSIINATVVMAVVARRGEQNVVTASPSPSGYTRGFSNETLLRSVAPTPSPTATPPTTQKSSIVPDPTATPTPTPTPSPKQVSGCIVVIDGVSYNVEPLRSTHSGGDIFECGSDMSAIFWREHNNRILQKMQKYKI